MKLKYEKSALGIGGAIIVSDKAEIYFGSTDHWGFAISYCHYDRSFTIEILNWFFGFAIWHKY